MANDRETRKLIREIHHGEIENKRLRADSIAKAVKKIGAKFLEDELVEVEQIIWRAYGRVQLSD